MRTTASSSLTGATRTTNPPKAQEEQEQDASIQRCEPAEDIRQHLLRVRGRQRRQQRQAREVRNAPAGAALQRFLVCVASSTHKAVHTVT